MTQHLSGDHYSWLLSVNVSSQVLGPRLPLPLVPCPARSARSGGQPASPQVDDNASTPSPSHSPCQAAIATAPIPHRVGWRCRKVRGLLEFPPLVSVQVGLPLVRSEPDLLSVCCLTSLTRTLCSIFFTNIIPQGEGCDFFVQNMWLFENLGSGFR